MSRLKMIQLNKRIKNEEFTFDSTNFVAAVTASKCMRLCNELSTFYYLLKKRLSLLSNRMISRPSGKSF